VNRLYRWVLSLAEHPQAVWILCLVSFAESSFFPIPPDVLLVPMALACPQRAWFYAAVCTLSSVIGGIFGYMIGAFLYDSVGQWLIHAYGSGDTIEIFRAKYIKYGHWILLIKGVLPIPYKLVTITAGFSSYSIFWFIILSFITRGLRFFTIALILRFFGDTVRQKIEQHTTPIALGLTICVVGGFVVFRYV
jgi:membrane protein YqaA with SNARE-associated domain